MLKFDMFPVSDFVQIEDPRQTSVVVSPDETPGGRPTTLKVVRDKPIVFGKFDAVLGPECKQAGAGLGDCLS
eukprot:752299-Hanusia_phi.AAC.2